MAAVQVIVVETEVKCDVKTMYHNIKHNLHHLPAMYPESYKGAEIVEGDATKIGCVRTWNYNLPGTTEVLHVKCKNIDMDDGKMTVGVSVIDGDTLKQYKSFVTRVSVTPRGNGCVVKWAIEYEKLNENFIDAYHYLELFENISLKMEAHVSN